MRFVMAAAISIGFFGLSPFVDEGENPEPSLPSFRLLCEQVDEKDG